MRSREATRFMFWAGEKVEAGDKLTDAELAKMKEAREVGKATAMKFLRLKPEDWKYTPGQGFK